MDRSQIEMQKIINTAIVDPHIYMQLMRRAGKKIPFKVTEMTETSSISQNFFRIIF